MQVSHWGIGKSGRIWGLLLPVTLLGCSLMSSALADEAPRKSKRENRPAAEGFPSSTAEGQTPPAEDGTGEAQIPADHPLAKVLKRAYISRKAMAEVKDYTALFVKKERFRGNPSKVVEQSMDVKVRHEPFSVYMRFRSPEAGREVIYVAGANNGKLLVHEEGISKVAGTLQFAINDPKVMKENRHPINKFGIANMLEVIIKQWEGETKFGEVEVKRYPNAKLGEIACEALVSIHPEPRNEFAFHKTVLYLDKQSKLPIRVEQWSWPRENRPSMLIEEYTYANLKANVRLENQDFDVHNPSYRFP